jgi:hypothetical protein
MVGCQDLLRRLARLVEVEVEVSEVLVLVSFQQLTLYVRLNLPAVRYCSMP